MTASPAPKRTNAATLDWDAFRAARFPHGRRHDFGAIVAYGAYRRSRAVGECSNGRAGSTALQGWEDEGGAV